MSDKTVIFITAYYPFAGGEQFIENELSCLPSSRFRFLFFPIWAVSRRELRSIGDQSELYEQVLVRPKWRRALYTVLALFCPTIYHEIMLLYKSQRLNIHTIFELLNFWADAELKYKKISKEIQRKRRNKQQIDLIYSYWMHEQAYISARLSKRYNIPCITRAHRSDLYEERNETDYLPFRQFILQSMKKVFCISQDGYNYIVSRYGSDCQEKVILSYLGTFDYGLNPSKEKEDFTIVSCSNIIAVKRIELIIKALSSITDHIIIWRHFGDGDQRDNIQKLASTCLAQNIKWHLEGAVSNRQIMDCYRRNHIDLFINVSSSEGLPVSIMEAMSFGIPVIATDVGGTSEIVQNGYNGTLIQSDSSPEVIAETIIAYIKMNDNTKDIYRRNARETWKEKFNAEKNYRTFYRELETLASQK